MRHYRKTDPDRHLLPRNGIYYYWRRIPQSVAALDTRPSLMRCSFKTDDLAEARIKRDAREAADNAYWAALLEGESSGGTALQRYKAAVKRVEAMGFSYKTGAEIAQAPLEEIVARVVAIMPQSTPAAVEQAILGRVDRPKVTWWDAFDVYMKEIVRTELAKKSPAQLLLWKNSRKRHIKGFIKLIGSKPLDEITREDARKWYNFWLDKIAPEDKEAKRYSPSSGNKAIGMLRTIYGRYFEHVKEDRQNPFANLGFKESEEGEAKRLPFASEWIAKKILAPSALAGLNDAARGITLAAIETGCRPAELCNIVPGDIFLDDEVPYIHIKSRTDPKDTRQIKTTHSYRRIPLVGVALAVFRKFPAGFPRYKDKESSLSATVNKYMTENGLRPTQQHSLYSLRHSWEDRLIKGGVDIEVRKVLMGHGLDRPQYGEKGDMLFRKQKLEAIAFDFDPSIVGPVDG